MIINGTFSVDATRDEAWRHLSDVPALAPLLPGCDSIQPAGEGVYQVGAQAKVGPIKTKLTGGMQIVDARAPESMQLRIEGQDAITASHVRAAILFRLTVAAPEETEVAYEADVLISGRLGTIGQGIMRVTVAMMLEEFVRRLNARIKGEPIDQASLAKLGAQAAARTLKGGVASLFRGTTPRGPVS
jgi:carbon monoxide dehydrogenase subunit G